MNASRIARRAFVALCLSVFAAIVLAQAQPGKTEYQPVSGQDGKDVVWVPTPQTLVEKMLDLAQVTPRDYVIDLGSGDGRLVIAAAKRGARALGIEYNPDMVELSKRNAATAGVGDKARFVKADLFESDFSQATVITMFLLPALNLQLRPKILDLKPGTRIVSNEFNMADWKPDQTAMTGTDCETGSDTYCLALLWIVPAKVAGTWRLPQGELKLEQRFQTVSGTLRSGNSIVPISNGTLRGEWISFSAGAAAYRGLVTGTTMEGTVAASGKTGKWSAKRAD